MSESVVITVPPGPEHAIRWSAATGFDKAFACSWPKRDGVRLPCRTCGRPMSHDDGNPCPALAVRVSYFVPVRGSRDV